MFSLAGKSVLVTGGSKGIGRGIASVFAAADANVAIGARSRADIESAVAALDGLGAGKVIGVAVDVSDRDSCTAMAEGVVGAFGGLDVLCANAGIFPERPAADHDPRPTGRRAGRQRDQGDRTYSVQACLDALIASGRGRIVLTSSITGPITGFPGWSHYGASKAAQLGFMRTAAIELAPHKITVNAVLPGNILTEGLAGSRRRLPGRDGAGDPRGCTRHAGRHRLRGDVSRQRRGRLHHRSVDRRRRWSVHGDRNVWRPSRGARTWSRPGFLPGK